MRTLAVVLALALPTTLAASVRPHSHDHKTKPAPSFSSACHSVVIFTRSAWRFAACDIAWSSVRWPRTCRGPGAPICRGVCHRSTVSSWWLRTDRHTRRLARIPLSRRIPRWREWHCIAHFESTRHWAMSPTSDPPSGGEYWGGLQMGASSCELRGRHDPAPSRRPRRQVDAGRADRGREPGVAGTRIRALADDVGRVRPLRAGSRMPAVSGAPGSSYGRVSVRAGIRDQARMPVGRALPPDLRRPEARSSGRF